TGDGDGPSGRRLRTAPAQRGERDVDDVRVTRPRQDVPGVLPRLRPKWDESRGVRPPRLHMHPQWPRRTGGGAMKVTTRLMRLARSAALLVFASMVLMACGGSGKPSANPSASIVAAERTDTPVSWSPPASPSPPVAG